MKSNILLKGVFCNVLYLLYKKRYSNGVSNEEQDREVDHRFHNTLIAIY